MYVITTTNRVKKYLTITLALVLIVILPKLGDAQGTHEWNDPTGGVFSTHGNWTPFGFPSSLDDAYFVLNTDYVVSFVNSRTVDYARFEGTGEVTFRAAGLTGGDRTFTANVIALVETEAQLILEPSSLSNRNLSLIANNVFSTFGRVTVKDGTQVLTPSTTVGINPLSGSIRIQGASDFGLPSMWETDELRIALGGTTVSDQGILIADNVDIEIGGLYATDPGSRIAVADTIDVGEHGFSAFNVVEGAIATANTINLAPTSVFATISVESGNPDKPSNLLATGDMFVAGRETNAGGFGEVYLNENSRTEVRGTLKIWDGGIVTMIDESTLVADVIDNSLGGVFEFFGGELQVDQFLGDLNNDGGLLAPGGAAVSASLVLGDYTASPAASLAIEIEGTLAGTNHDLVNVSGQALVDGTLEINLANGYLPNPDDSFTVLASSSLFGSFDNASNGQRVATNDGLGSFIANYGIGSPFDENRVVLSDFEASFILGDVNGDGLVNLFDVIPFVETVTNGAFVPAADINQDGVVDLVDVEPFVNLLAG